MLLVILTGSRAELFREAKELSFVIQLFGKREQAQAQIGTPSPNLHTCETKFALPPSLASWLEAACSPLPASLSLPLPRSDRRRAETFRRVRADLVEDHRNVGSAGEKLRVGALHESAVAGLGFSEHQDFIHELCHGNSNTGLA